MKRLHLMLVVAAAVVASIAGVAGARADSQGKAQVCHGTASDTNQFVQIDVSVNALPAQLGTTDARAQSFLYDPSFATCDAQFLANNSL